MKILVIEDERKLARFIKQGLEQNGHTADICFSGTEGMRLLSGNGFDAVLLDMMLPGQSGLDVLRNMREFNIAVPVVIISAVTQTEKVVEGLDMGAVDYIRKPFDFEELLARLRALQRTAGKVNSNTLAVADIEVDLLKHQVKKAGITVELTNREFALLQLFMQKPGRLITKTEISDKVWEAHYDMGSNVIEVHVYQLRKKLDAFGSKDLIKTIIGRGYQLVNE
jgi:two-component system copper resistance phosphate regulon response regulator CusR